MTQSYLEKIGPHAALRVILHGKTSKSCQWWYWAHWKLDPVSGDFPLIYEIHPAEEGRCKLLRMDKVGTIKAEGYLPFLKVMADPMLREGYPERELVEEAMRMVKLDGLVHKDE